MNEPSLLVPYAGPDASGDTCDVYLYLRPETNGVLTESVMMKTIVGNRRWKDSVKLVYLANYPGDFIQTLHLVEHHYRVKIFFARNGGKVFSKGMRQDFEEKFQTEFNEDKVLGAYDALKATGLNEEELFAYRVGEEDMMVTLGQNVKRRGDIWIVNYDIPAILHRNTFNTDIAVMVFRVSLSWEDFHNLIQDMTLHLVDSGVLGSETAPSRAFHYSKSPWEQLLDGIDYLWGVDISAGGAENLISFGAYMLNHGYTRQQLRDIIRRPLILYRDEEGKTRERNIFELSSGLTYSDTEKLMKNVVGTLNLKPFEGWTSA